jgi:hypothetical protein
MQLGSSRDVLENVVPMMASVEAAFDAQRICVLPTMDEDTRNVSFVVSWKSVTARTWAFTAARGGGGEHMVMYR